MKPIAVIAAALTHPAGREPAALAQRVDLGIPLPHPAPLPEPPQPGGVPRPRFNRMDPVSRLAVDLASRCCPPSGERAAVFWGLAQGCIGTNLLFEAGRTHPERPYADPILFKSTVASAAAAQVAILTGCLGGGLTSVSGRLAGGEVLLEAAAALRSGEIDHALVGAGERATPMAAHFDVGASPLVDAGACLHLTTQPQGEVLGWLTSHARGRGPWWELAQRAHDAAPARPGPVSWILPPQRVHPPELPEGSCLAWGAALGDPLAAWAALAAAVALARPPGRVVITCEEGGESIALVLEVGPWAPNRWP